MRSIIAILIILILAMTSCTAPVQSDASDDQAELEQIQKEKKELEQRLKEIEDKTTQVEKVEEQEKEPAAVVVEQPETKSVTPEVPPSPVEQKVKVVESAEMSTEVKELLSRADSKIKSYSYTMAPPPDQLARNQWLIKGTKIKVELYEDNYVEPDTYFDTMFLDAETKTADGYCLNQRTTRCAQPGQHFDLDYNDVYEKTPYQWLKEVKGVPKIISSEVVYDRRVSVIEYKDGSDTYKQWIDQFSGLPIRVERNGSREGRWEFRYLAINNVLDSDIRQP